MTDEEWAARRRRRDVAIASLPRPRICMMADYNAPPLWECDDAEDAEPIANDTLETLRPELRERLERWAQAYGQGAVPYGMSVEEEEKMEIFEREGIALWRKLREELAGRVSVLYYSVKRSELVARPEDLLP